MNSVRSLMVAVCLVLSSASLAMSQEPVDAHRANVEKLIDLMGAMKTSDQMSHAMSAPLLMAIKSQHPEIPQELLDAIPTEVDSVISAHLPEFRAMTVEIYLKHFTPDEIEQLVVFYSAPLGQKMVSIMPELLQESMASGMKWGASLMPEVDRRIRARLKRSNVDL